MPVSLSIAFQWSSSLLFIRLSMLSATGGAHHETWPTYDLGIIGGRAGESIAWSTRTCARSDAKGRSNMPVLMSHWAYPWSLAERGVAGLSSGLLCAAIMAGWMLSVTSGSSVARSSPSGPPCIMTGNEPYGSKCTGLLPMGVPSSI